MSLKPSRKRLKSNGFKRKSTKLNSKKKLGKGKKTQEWINIRSFIYQELADKGITSCELKGMLGDCTGSLFPSLAHSRKRRDIKTDLEMREVIWCCISEHQLLEYLSKDEMYQIVTQTIAKRM